MSPQPRRTGYTLLELVISMGSSVILMAGLSSVLFISTQALTPDATLTATDQNNRSSLVTSQLVADLRIALSFSERTARTVTFTVPDRNADGQVETLRYSWTGVAGDPLLYQYNSNPVVTLAANVQQFNLAALTRVIPADTLSPPPTSVVYSSFEESKQSSGGANSLSVNKPSGTAAGDLLIAAVSIDANNGTTLTAPAGWTLLSRLTSSSAVGVGVWWKLATASEPASYTLSWTGAAKAYGWIMRFTGADATSPINGFVTNVGTSSAPACLAATTTINNTMVVRIGGFDDGDVSVDNAGISNYTTITMDRSDTGSSSASGGAAFTRLPAAGTTGQVNFSLTSGAEEFVTFTIAIAPDDGI